MATPAFVKPGPNDIEVKIGFDESKKAITVAPDTFIVSKGLKPTQKVMWVCTRTGDHVHGDHGIPCFTVDFNKNVGQLDSQKHLHGSPFRNWHFCGYGSVSSDLAVVDPTNEKLYKYTVSMCGHSVDPAGGVEP